jgi:hypothetical protein
MTTLTTGPISSGAQISTESIQMPRRRRALAVRRGFLVAAPVLAGIFAIIGAVADPGAGISGHKMFELYTDNPGRLQFKSLGFHWAYAFWGLPALLVAAYVKGKGAWLANVAAFVGFVGVTTLPGLLVTDWYDSAIGQVYGGADAVQAVQDQMSDTMWGIPFMVVPGMLGLLLGLPLAVAALWRGGVVRWWAFAAVLLGSVAFLGSGVRWWGCTITLICFSVFAYALAKGTKDRTEI